MIDLNKLKELALIWSRSDVACMEVVTFSDLSSTPLDDAQVMFGAANALGDLIDRLEAAGALADFRGKNISSLDNLIADRDKRIAELEEENSQLEVVSLDRKQRAEAAEAELARRDAAAGEPVALRWRFIPPWPDIPVMAWTYIDNPKYFSDVRGMEGADIEELFTAAHPSALPPEMTLENAKGLTVFGKDNWCKAYNQAIADAKALGCKAIKLPEPYDDGQGNEWLPCAATRQALKAQGFTVEGE